VLEHVAVKLVAKVTHGSYEFGSVLGVRGRTELRNRRRTIGKRANGEGHVDETD